MVHSFSEENPRVPQKVSQKQYIQKNPKQGFKVVSSLRIYKKNQKALQRKRQYDGLQEYLLCFTGKTDWVAGKNEIVSYADP